jgi:hypothetical protein
VTLVKLLGKFSEKRKVELFLRWGEHCSQTSKTEIYYILVELLILIKKEGLSLNYVDTAKKGYKLIKTAAKTYTVVKVVKENVQNIHKTITEIDETITEGKKVVSKGNSYLHRIIHKKNGQDKEQYVIIEKPITDNKVEIYEWMYNKSEKIKDLLIKNLREFCKKRKSQILTLS